MAYEAYVLTAESRADILYRFTSKFSDVIGHHVTHAYGIPRRFNVPYGERTHGDFELIGMVSDDKIETFIVTVQGREFRPDGKRYHLTWSRANQAVKPVYSNVLIASTPFHRFQRPIRFSAVFDYVS